MASDFVAAPSTIATSTKVEDTSNILSKTIRPNFRKTFHKAIARQRVNIMAINAFASGLNQQKKKVNFAKSACDALPQQRFSCVISHDVFTAPKLSQRRPSHLVSDLMECSKAIANERRNTLLCEQQLSNQAGPKKIVKDVQIDQNKSKTASRFLTRNSSTTASMSQTNYEDFFEKKRNEQEKELQKMTRSLGSKVAKSAVYQKHQISKVANAEKSECWFEADTGNDKNQKEWARKCILSCNGS